jgi:hypothetical protein
MTGPKPLPKQALHIMQSRASSFRWEYPVLSLRSSSSLPHLLSHLPVTSIPPFLFPSVTCCRRQFLCKMWPIELAFCLLISCRRFLCSLTVSNTSSFLTWLVQTDLHSSPTPHFKTFQLFVICCLKHPSFSRLKVTKKMKVTNQTCQKMRVCCEI